jgi:hypothetical protein
MKLPAIDYLHNVSAFVAHPSARETVLSRIPDSLRVRLNDHAQQRALHCAGCEFRFRLNGPEATIRIRACEVGARKHGGGLAQILCGDFSHTYLPVTEAGVAECILTDMDYAWMEKVPAVGRLFHPRLVRILLPTHASICELSVEGDIALPEPGDTPGRRVLNYGSSITQGAGSLTCRESWAGYCAQQLGADLINLGFGGGCHCEHEMTDYLCGRSDFDFAILETGINMLGLDPDLTNERIDYLIRRISATHPDKPVYCLGVFPCLNDIKFPLVSGAQAIREWVKSVVADVNSPNLYFIDAGEAMTPALGLTSDLVHPSPAGMIEIGRKIAARIEALQSGS